MTAGSKEAARWPVGATSWQAHMYTRSPGACVGGDVDIWGPVELGTHPPGRTRRAYAQLQVHLDHVEPVTRVIKLPPTSLRSCLSCCCSASSSTAAATTCSWSKSPRIFFNSRRSSRCFSSAFRRCCEGTGTRGMMCDRTSAPTTLLSQCACDRVGCRHPQLDVPPAVHHPTQHTPDLRA